MTGQKAPIQIINKLGDCCNYDTVFCGNAQAELSQELTQQKIPFFLKPGQPGKHVLTYFWWHSFDCRKENLKGSIHTTHGIAFQEKSELSTSIRSVTSISPSSKKALKVKT